MLMVVLELNVYICVCVCVYRCAAVVSQISDNTPAFNKLSGSVYVLVS